MLRGAALALVLGASACTSAVQADDGVGTTSTDVQSSSAAPITAAPTTTSTEAPTTSVVESGCGPFGTVHTLDQVWPAGTELELLIDTSVNDDDFNVLRHARQVLVRSNGMVDGDWSLTYIDPVGERLANYASRVSVQNPVDEASAIEVDYVVGPVGEVAFLDVDGAARIDAGYADFVFDVFGPTDGGLGADKRFQLELTDLFAGGGFELLDTTSASNRILGVLTSVHESFGQSFVLGEPSTTEGSWIDVGLPRALDVGEIQVASSIGSGGCLLIESTAAVGQTKFERRVQMDARGFPVSVTSFVRFGDDRSNLKVTTTIGFLSTDDD